MSEAQAIERITSADVRAYRAAMRALGLFDSRPWLNRLKVPVLVVSGADDTTVSPQRQKMLLNGIPGARQVIIQQAGHALSIDQSDQFNRLLLEFFKD